MILKTNRLIIRPVIVDDSLDVFTYRSDRETNRFQGWIPETIEDVRMFIENIAKQIDVPHTWFQFVLVVKLTNMIIGDLGVHFFDAENRQVEIGCTLNKKFHRKGFATESLKRVIDFLFYDLHKHRIVTSIDPDNESSIRLVERLGFRKEAHFVESLFLNGRWVDDIIYALLERDWKS